MKIYLSKETGALFYAEMPSAFTSVEFLHEAASYDIFLFKLSHFDPYFSDRWKEPFYYYFKQNITDIKIVESEYLLLPADERVREKYGKGTFIICHECFFREKYEQLD